MNGYRVGGDGKSYPPGNDPDEREFARGWVHKLSHQGLSIREVQAELATKGITRSIGSISNDLRVTTCPNCSGGETAHLNTEEEKDMQGDEDGALIGNDGLTDMERTERADRYTETAKRSPSAGEREAIDRAKAQRDRPLSAQEHALIGHALERMESERPDAEEKSVNLKFALVADMLRMQTANDLNSEGPTPHEAMLYAILDKLAAEWAPHPNDLEDQAGSLIEWIFWYVGASIVSDHHFEQEADRG